ncbi:MAG TPA: DUF512 domain-containing protein [Peptococcaceae bacterium]|nr:MAG: hypothetical protein XD51_0385 [Moorella sp. 60_41]HBT46431.1 DUF512 domain-containing protein [Peptococcaceae bacterium]
MPKTRGATIAAVTPGSIAAQIGLKAGDVLVSVNGEEVEDIIAYRYLTADESLVVEVIKAGGERWVVEIEKDYGEDLGLEFAEAAFDGMRRCNNKCLFCFVDQMPPGLRSTLYLKDDDYRFSFLHGNFITLTNLREEDWERIFRQRLSPLYISVHTTNPVLRAGLLGNGKAGNILEHLTRLQEGGIEFHTQIVLCPGVNDGKELDRTLSDLADFFPALGSIGVVPVGLTAYREKLYPLRRYSAEEARAIIGQIEDWQREFRSRFGRGLVYAADEFYILGGRPLPEAPAYDGFPQEENGIGLTRIFIDEFHRELAAKHKTLKTCGREGEKTRAVIATGRLAAPVLEELVKAAKARMPGLEARVVGISNSFFGPQVTVAGLLTGQDLARGLREADVAPGERILLPDVMLRKDDQVFLDDWTVEDLRLRLDREIEVVPTGGAALARALLG